MADDNFEYMKDLSMHVMDIVQNSITACATKIGIVIVENTGKDTYTIEITDNGRGMSESTLKQATDPYFTTRTTRKVGLGIPLLKMNCERTGGWMRIESELSKGTHVTAVLGLANIDRPATGDLAGTIALLAIANPAIEITYRHSKDRRKYEFNTKEVTEALDGIPINDPSVYPLLKEMIKLNLDDLGIT